MGYGTEHISSKLFILRQKCRLLLFTGILLGDQDIAFQLIGKRSCNERCNKHHHKCDRIACIVS